MKFNYNIFKGILSLIVLSFLFVTLMPLVNSGSEVINTFLVYEDSASSTSKTVTQGDVFNVVMVAYGHGEALQNERLELVGSTLIFQEAVSGDKIDTYTWLYTKTYTLNTGILTPGTYTLRFTARTAITQSVEYSDLQLTILPKVNPIVCGNNIKEGTEQCDYGTDNGKPCNPLYGSSCTYCSSTCKLVTINGPSCGDGTCSAVNGETCSTCSQDCGVCPDNIKPVVDITDPLATTYTSHRTSLTFSVYDDNLQSCTYKLNGNAVVNIPSIVNGVKTITGITSVVGSNTWTVTCRDVAGNTGTDSVTFTVNLPTVCGDGTCNSNENCSTCSQDCGVCPVACDLTQAYWSVSSTLNGQVVSLNVKGTNCNGKTILFKVWNDKTGSSDLYVTDTAIDVMENGFASSAWVAIAPYDGDTTPEYYFIASIFEGTENVKSGNLLVTLPATCGDGTCNSNENCSTCPTDCGVCPDNIKPVVNIINPANTTYTSHRTSLTFSVYDDNLQSCTYKLNGAPQVNVVSLKNGINIITGITSVTGKNTWEVVCRDASGNTGTDSVTFTIACLPTCGDGTCNNGETCSTCPQDCGTCPKNCTVCKDSKPLDDSNYVPSGKTVIVYDDSDDSSLSDKQEKALDENKTPLIALILIIGILILLILVIIIRLARR